MTRPLDGLLRTAVRQSVGAGCCLGGTLSSQMRHIPGGGRYAFGTSSPDFWARALPASPAEQASARSRGRRLMWSAPTACFAMTWVTAGAARTSCARILLPSVPETDPRRARRLDDVVRDIHLLRFLERLHDGNG